MVYMNCLRRPTCLVEMRYKKQTNEAKLLGNHTDSPPDDHVFKKIAFEAFLKNEMKDHKNAKITPLNLYKQALRKEFKGIWLPDDHKSKFLEKMRRIRKYNKTKKPSRKVVDSSTSPIQLGTPVNTNHQNLSANTVQLPETFPIQNEQLNAAILLPKTPGKSCTELKEAASTSSKQSVSTSPFSPGLNFTNSCCVNSTMFQLENTATLSTHSPLQNCFMPEIMLPEKIIEYDLIDFNTPPQPSHHQSQLKMVPECVYEENLIVHLLDLGLSPNKSDTSSKKVSGLLHYSEAIKILFPFFVFIEQSEHVQMIQYQFDSVAMCLTIFVFSSSLERTQAITQNRRLIVNTSYSLQLMTIHPQTEIWTCRRNQNRPN